ncbi:amidohydrolase family protein [Saxibacter everestensis]|uniref:Amidohydrolase family protein n=1 Tax=Saxibacter everestensis TaxID=2909229 RepID=A0ABY8QRZ2_9MICO|nr:amidohydrolase family protein [Brevibacteriaceae bacterium ZFBP1038]
MGNHMDVVIRGGTVVTADGRAECDVGIANGRISQLGGEMTTRSTLDARGAYVVPSAVDPHVHLCAPEVLASETPEFVDDFYTGSLAAIGGGVGTIGQMSFPFADDESLRAAVSRDASAAGQEAAVDYFLHPGITDAGAETLEQISALASEGYSSLKLPMLAFDWGARNLVEAVQRAADAGMLTMVHCEDEALIRFCTARLEAQGRDGVENYPLSRPDVTERAAVERAIAICELTGAQLDIVHLSSASALAVTRSATLRGLPVYVETRPMYLYLTDEVHSQPDGGRFVGMPPLKKQADVDALWAGLADGSIQTIGSDHAPWTLEQKTAPGLTVSTVPRGVPELETFLPMLFTFGVLTGRISLERMVAVTATNAARLFGLYPKKGSISVGADADLVVLDPGKTRVIDGRTMHSKAGYSPYDGWEARGWPRFVLSRGDLVLSDDTVTASAGRGLEVPRGARLAPSPSPAYPVPAT